MMWVRKKRAPPAASGRDSAPSYMNLRRCRRAKGQWLLYPKEDGLCLTLDKFRNLFRIGRLSY